MKEEPLASSVIVELASLALRASVSIVMDVGNRRRVAIYASGSDY